ncbi:fungal-specific transcription factor domain-containing protein [Mycena maculata]|uniref:Fungal-specific transcription factor domain-containing protein n=1 Tax=Mycena maculata TaxID=230809 RepID=A0AAD7J9T7_9AGAR|nr:fungal-specific transcription factor domain-containing protein [Mycena maculata]
MIAAQRLLKPSMSDEEPSMPWAAAASVPDAASQNGTKSRRPQRSCDYCRQRKIKCDGPKTNGGRCSNCLDFRSQCTYLHRIKKRGPKSKLVEDLERENAALKAKLRSLSVCSLCAQPLQSGPTSPSVFENATLESDVAPSTPDRRHAEEDISQDELADRFHQLSIGGLKGKFFGSASSFALVSNAIAVKGKYLGQPATAAPHSRRTVYYDVLPWEKELYDQRPHYVYPANDLISSLLELYFTNVHPMVPVLHRPSFECAVTDRLHLTDTKFGATLLAVLALASRYSDDPRVLVDGNLLSSGWKFVAQVQTISNYFEPSLYEVQFYCLATLYSLGTSTPQASWLFLGLGIRFLQHRGAHRRKREGHNFEDELWNRAFWTLFALDRIIATFLGRAPAIHIEDFDVEPPLEVDDEYWERGFAQPLGKPSTLSFFVYLSRLCEILGDALRRLYASKKWKTRMGWIGAEWEQGAVAELDSAMNDFFDSIPPHLRWDTNRRRGVFFEQSALLHATYYYIQITIHRPYILDHGPLAPTSLSICMAAARSALHIARIWMDEPHYMPFFWLQTSVFVSAVIVLLNIFGSRRVGLSIDTPKDLAHVETALELLKSGESR